MNVPEGFEQIGKRGFYRPSAQVTFAAAVEMVAAAIRYARARELTDLLANTCGLSGFPPPNTLERYDMAVKWVESAGVGQLRVALIARPEIIDPNKIGVLMAQNRGMLGDVFKTEAEALAWLDARRTLNR
jgi:hypothetical protein